MFDGIINASLHTSVYQFTLQAYQCPTSVLSVSTGQAVCVSVCACCFSSQARKTFVCNNDWFFKMKHLLCSSTNYWSNYVPIVFLFEGNFFILLHLFKMKNYGIKVIIVFHCVISVKKGNFFLQFPNITSGLLTEVYLECISMAVILQ